MRIGKPLRPEFAAWRYGRQFSQRRTHTILAIGGAGILTAGLLAGSAALGAFVILPYAANIAYLTFKDAMSPERSIDIPRGGWHKWIVSTAHSAILPDGADGWKLIIRLHLGTVEYRGADARRFLVPVLAKVIGRVRVGA